MGDGKIVTWFLRFMKEGGEGWMKSTIRAGWFTLSHFFLDNENEQIQ